MILGVDHLALTSTDIDRTHDELLAKGFQCKFLERAVPNHPSKSHLLVNYLPVHDLAFYNPPAGIPIEVTVHGPQAAPRGAPFEYNPQELVLTTGDRTCETDFLCQALRFRQLDPDRLRLVSPVANWCCTIRIQEHKMDEPCVLDASGYPCLALLTNGLDADLEKALRLGAHEPSQVFHSRIDGQTMRVVMFRSPTGIIYELIEVETGRKK